MELVAIVFAASWLGGAIGTGMVLWGRDYQDKKKTVVKKRARKVVSAVVKANGHAETVKNVSKAAWLGK